MKKLLPFLVLVLLYQYTKAQQVKFCTPGASWKYSFQLIPAFNGVLSFKNASVTYTGDSISGMDTIKILSHQYFYKTCYNPSTIALTLLKQNGDTVFFSNAKTNYTWQQLLNFAAVPGSTWQTTVLRANGNPQVYSYSVTAVTQVSINGQSLKRITTNNGTYTERLGFDNNYFFPFLSYAAGCDGYVFVNALCYSDNSLGTVQYDARGCDFSGVFDLNGLDDISMKTNIEVYPNPAQNQIYLRGPYVQEVNYKLINCNGETVQKGTASSTLPIPTIELSSGMYFLQLQSATAQKVVKVAITRH